MIMVQLFYSFMQLTRGLTEELFAEPDENLQTVVVAFSSFHFKTVPWITFRRPELGTKFFG